MHIAYFIGTRPEVIRSAKVLRLLESESSIELSIINSGQHYDANMMGSFLRELNVPEPLLNLNVGSGDRATQVASIFARCAKELAALKPSCLCVFGDTNSSLGAALGAMAEGTPLVHIEAGCRSYDMEMPEEVNRRLIDHMAGLLLPVSDLCVHNLEFERVPGVIKRIGDPLLDVFIEATGGKRDQGRGSRVASDKDGAKNRLGLVTLHRVENVDDPARLKLILESLEEAASVNALQWIFPVHPRTLNTLPPEVFRRIQYVDPMGYGALLGTLAESQICVTDSGGLQKEALWMKKPCVTVRKSTEWIETVLQGCNTMSQPGPDLVRAVSQGLDPSIPRNFADPYGSKDAAREIIDAILSWVRGGATFNTLHESALKTPAK